METIKQRLKVDRREINYLRVTLESYDGMAVVGTVDPYAAIIEVGISPGCREMVFDLLRDLEDREGMHMEVLQRDFPGKHG